MNSYPDIIGNWVILLGVITTLAAAPVETVVKPFLHEIADRTPDPVGFKNSKRYGYLLRAFMGLFALIEALTVGNEINIFAQFGIDSVSNEAVACGVALLVPIFSSQIHDAATFVKLWVGNKANTQ